MRRKNTKTRSIVAWIFGIYAAVLVFCNLPFMQRNFADWTASALAKQLGTKVEIGNVNLGFLNAIIIDDLYIEDLSHKEMLKVGRISASLDIIDLITKGEISISSAQLFGAKANIYKATPEKPYNFQFVLDAFSSDSEESHPINLSINSLIVRRAAINYNILYEESKKTLDPNHLNIENAGFNLNLKKFSPDSLNVVLKRFSGIESNSDLDIKEIAFQLVGNKERAKLSNFYFAFPNSEVNIDSANVDYHDYAENKQFSFDETNIVASVLPSELKFLLPQLHDFDERIVLSTTLSGTHNKLVVKDLSLFSNDNSLTTDLSGQIENYSASNPSFNANIRAFHLSQGQLEKLVSPFMDNTEDIKTLFNVGSIDFTGTIEKNATSIDSEGKFITDAGLLEYTANYNSDHFLNTKIHTSEIDIRRILDDESFGKANVDVDGIIDLSKKQDIPSGKLNAIVSSFDYKGYTYNNINFDATNADNQLVVKASSEDDNVNVKIDGTLENINGASKTILASLDVKNFNPHALNLIDGFAGENYSFNLNTNGTFTDLNHLKGNATLRDMTLTTRGATHAIDNLVVDASLNGSSDQYLNVNSDILDANITGQFTLNDVINDFQNIIASHLPVLVEHKPSSSQSDIDYELTLRDAPILHHFINEDFTIEEPIHIAGHTNSSSNYINMNCQIPHFTYNGNLFENLRINCSSSMNNMTLTLEGGNKSDASQTSGKIIATAHNNKVDADVKLLNQAKDKLDLNLYLTSDFSRHNGHLMTNLNFHKSKFMINDDEWKISLANINYCNNELECQNFKISNGNQYLEINGRASENPNDSLVALLNDIEVAYILDLVNFHSVEFGGKASGRAIVNNIFGKPDANATLYVKDFSLQDGVLGDASILAHWDREREGIAVNAHIADHYLCNPLLTGIPTQRQGTLEVNGYILPIKEELSLDLLINDTHTDFLKGFVGSIFKDIDGYLNGTLSIVGPFSDVNLIGDVNANMKFTLNATNVPYCINGDEVHLRHHLFDFTDIQVHDRNNNVGVFNGKMTHVNLANFKYDFRADVTNLCVYNEHEFNSDKFLAQVWANGDVHLYGADGHPFTIDANITPCKGSVFAYDSATPDALISNSFIDFRDITNYDELNRHDSPLISPLSPSASVPGLEFESNTSSSFTHNDRPTYLPSNAPELVATPYVGDLYMNVNIDLNPNCEIKLRMDNTPDGYISTFGNGTFQAKYYNKGSFQLFGNYNITNGRYRLYLQDVVYRDLDIQDGSKVEFNGNPFDANIHLICKNEVQSAQLSNLTQTSSFTSNNKVKVDCLLDITGHLDNMELKFSFELPNVSDETRQVVRSMINSDEEMNKQVIYLLAARNFYPSEYAQNSIETYGTQAVNSLLSSTLSGQINQVLSNLVGSRSKWNFGTDISTGEDWQHLDVEGSVSGSLLDDRLLINGNFGYRDNSLTNQTMFIGDFEVKYRLWKSGDFFVKAYNQANDRYFTKATLNTQGVGLSFQHDFENYTLFQWMKKLVSKSDTIGKK